MTSAMEEQRFNTQPPEGGWLIHTLYFDLRSVSTHSRPKAAGRHHHQAHQERQVSTHSRPKAAGALTNVGGKVN